MNLYTVYDDGQIADNHGGHDATIIYFDGLWIAQWDDGQEGQAQTIWQRTSTDLATWSPRVAVYTTTAGATNPIADPTIYQPSLVVVGSELWSFFKGNAGVYQAKLSASTGRWTTSLLFGDAGRFRFPVDEHGVTWRFFPGNNGIVLGSGRIVVPVTMQEWIPHDDFFDQNKRDAILCSDDDGLSWQLSQVEPIGDATTQAWESTVWQPEPGRLNMISRNNRRGTLLPRENLKQVQSSDEGDTWGQASLLNVLDTAMSRAHVVRHGARNIMAQNDWYQTATSLDANRRNLSLFFSRGNRTDTFVAGLNLATTEMTAQDQPMSEIRLSYPQIGLHGSTAAVIYTRNRVDRDGSIRVAKIAALPADDTYYLFPRQGYRLDHTAAGHWPVQAVTVDGRAAARFKDGWASAGIDLDASASSQDVMQVRFTVKVESSGRQVLFTSKTAGGVKLIASGGRLLMKKWSGGITELDCGALTVGVWTTVDLVATGTVTSARAYLAGTTPPSYRTLAYGSYPWQPYFGDNAYSTGITWDLGASFLVDLASVATRVQSP